MRIKMLRTPGVLRGQEQRLVEGKEYDLADDEGQALVDQLLAVPVAAKKAEPPRKAEEPRK